MATPCTYGAAAKTSHHNGLIACGKLSVATSWIGLQTSASTTTVDASFYAGELSGNYWADISTSRPRAFNLPTDLSESPGLPVIRSTSTFPIHPASACLHFQQAKPWESTFRKSARNKICWTSRDVILIQTSQMRLLRQHP